MLNFILNVVRPDLCAALKLPSASINPLSQAVLLSIFFTPRSTVIRSFNLLYFEYASTHASNRLLVFSSRNWPVNSWIRYPICS